MTSNAPHGSRGSADGERGKHYQRTQAKHHQQRVPSKPLDAPNRVAPLALRRRQQGRQGNAVARDRVQPRARHARVLQLLHNLDRAGFIGNHEKQSAKKHKTSLKLSGTRFVRP
jgi:hypothetical protein